MEALEQLRALMFTYELAKRRLDNAIYTLSIATSDWTKKEVEVKHAALTYWKRKIIKQAALL